MHRSILTSLALVILGGPVAAQNTKALDLIPDDALGFIIVNDLRQLSNKVESVAKKLGVEERVSFLEMIQKQLGVRDGIDDRGSAVFIVMDSKAEKLHPGWLLALPVTDYAKIASQLGVKQPQAGINRGEMGVQSPLLAGIGVGPDEQTKKQPVLFAKRADFVLLAPPENQDALERALGPQKSIATSVRQARDWFAEQDICGACTQHGVKKAGLILMGAGVASNTEGQTQRMKETFADVEKNVNLIAFGGRIDEPGHWRLTTRVYFNPAGSYAKWIADAQPADGQALARLPDQSYVFAAMARISPQMNFEDGIDRLLAAFPPTDDAVDQISKNAARIVQRISEVGLAVYERPRIESAPMIDFGLVSRVDDAPAFIAGAVELVKQVHQATKEKSKAEVTFEQKKLAERPGWLIRIADSKAEQNAGKQPPPSKQGTLALTELDARTVLISGSQDAERAESAVKKVAAGSGQRLTTNAGIQKSAALLPEKPQLAAYVNIAGLGFIPVKEAECPPVAFALRALPASIEAQFVIPFETVQAVVKALNEKKKPEPYDDEPRPANFKEGPMLSVAFLPNNKECVTCGHDGAVTLWDIATGKKIRTYLTIQWGTPTSVAVSPDGKQVVATVTSSREELQGLYSWNYDGSPRFKHIEKRVDHVVFTPTGDQFLYYNGKICLADARDGKTVRQLDGHKGGINKLVVSPDGRSVIAAVGNYAYGELLDPLVRVWDLKTGKLVRTIEGEHGVEAVAVSPDGRRAAAGDYMGVIWVWDTSNWTELRQFDSEGQMKALAFSVDGRFMISCCETVGNDKNPAPVGCGISITIAKRSRFKNQSNALGPSPAQAMEDTC